MPVKFIRLVCLVLTVLISCKDKAQDGFGQCQQLLAAGQLQAASAACSSAYEASPQSPFGVKAAEAKAAIDEKIDNIIPPTVTRDWCARLAAHLEPRLQAQAAAKFPNRDPAFIQDSVHGNVENTQYDCNEDAGKPTTGLWTCRWNETFDSAADCDKLEDHPHHVR